MRGYSIPGGETAHIPVILLGLAPLHLTSKVASSYAAGFTIPHDIHETRAQMLGKIKVLLAGGIAEEIVFGPDNATTGRSRDREQATMLTLDFVRKHGFDREFQATTEWSSPTLWTSRSPIAKVS